MGVSTASTERLQLLDRASRQLLVSLGLLTLSSIGTGYNMTLVGGLLANQRWFHDLGVPPEGPLLGLTLAASLLGCVIGAVPAALLSDLVGRRRTIMLASLIGVGTTVGQASCHNWASFLATRTVTGLASIGILIGGQTLVAEISPTKQRALITALWPGAFYLGAIIAAWCVYGGLHLHDSWSWRLPVLGQTLWFILQGCAGASSPESPRWLILRGRHADAQRVMDQYYRPSSSDTDRQSDELSQCASDTRAESALPNLGWSAFLQKENRTRTCLILLLGVAGPWCGISIVQGYFPRLLSSFGIESGLQQAGLNGGLEVLGLAMAILGALLADTCGRRNLLLASTAFMLFSLAGFTGSSAVFAQHRQPSVAHAGICFMFIFVGAFSLGFNPIMTLVVTESMPTGLRARAMCVYWMLTTVGLAVGTFVNPIAIAALQFRYYFVHLSVLVIIFGGIMFLAPEIKGVSLEESVRIFDRQHAATGSTITKEEDHSIQIDELTKSQFIVSQTSEVIRRTSRVETAQY